MASSYSIGTPGVAWGVAEKAEWRDSRTIQRSYQDEVVTKIHALSDRFQVASYGTLSQDPEKYVMYSVKTKNWSSDKPCVLITGGVHGYETSGVQGALVFLQTQAEAFSEHFNILVCPCVSPWGYETIQRWNAAAVDPNRSCNPDGEIVKGRSFNPEAATEESRALLDLFKELDIPQWSLHIDLHETTDTDDTEFRPAKAARDGVQEPPNEDIPDGFYLVAQPGKTQPEFFSKLIEAVRQVTHIAPTDPDGNLIGEPVIQEGVILIPATFQDLGLCAGMTNAEYATLTEVYPDSPNATDDICNQAQVACIVAALQHIQTTLKADICPSKE
eukprot:CAMPEP_0198299568 /NCGR_PEP_ID=MMETSP1449-20131203/45256_1 /TAXON_ID=420275 /ORGANISM="Attheya septentrionalis, Strain CCMP2084" /LENGTH=329 /DNA_ID=CAMNT_0044001169 /DNA_START=63 /DNA_END=1052 /DNA_ORIENTATION=+